MANAIIDALAPFGVTHLEMPLNRKSSGGSCTRAHKHEQGFLMHEQHWTASLTPLMAVGVALLLGAGLIWASGASVLEAYGGLFAGMCGSWQALSETGWRLRRIS